MSDKNKSKEFIAPLPLVWLEMACRFGYRVFDPETYMKNWASEGEKEYYYEKKKKKEENKFD